KMNPVSRSTNSHPIRYQRYSAPNAARTEGSLRAISFVLPATDATSHSIPQNAGDWHQSEAIVKTCVNRSRIIPITSASSSQKLFQRGSIQSLTMDIAAMIDKILKNQTSCFDDFVPSKIAG